MSKIPKRVGRDLRKLKELRPSPKLRRVSYREGHPHPTYNRRNRKGSLNRRARWG